MRLGAFFPFFANGKRIDEGKKIGNLENLPTVGDIIKDNKITFSPEDQQFIWRQYGSNPLGWKATLHHVPLKNFNTVKVKKNGEISTNNIMVGHLGGNFTSIQDHLFYKYLDSLWDEVTNGYSQQTGRTPTNKEVFNILTRSDFNWPEQSGAYYLGPDSEGHTPQKFQGLFRNIGTNGYNVANPILVYQNNIGANGAHRLAAIEMLRNKKLLNENSPISVLKFRDYPGMTPTKGLKEYLRKLVWPISSEPRLGNIGQGWWNRTPLPDDVMPERTYKPMLWNVFT
jgi:hypothetical protein